MKVLLLVLSLVGANMAEWAVDLTYSVNNFESSFPLGKIELRRTFDGNYTGSFKPQKDSKLLDHLRSSKDGLYRIQANTGGTVLTSFTKPCLILQSDLYHIFAVSLDGEQQKLLSVTVYPDVVAAGGQLEESKCESSSRQINGVVQVTNRGVLPSPDTQAFVNKMEKERKARQHGAAEDNRSFIAKYWMYIVPVVIFMVISNAVNPEAAQGE